MTSIVVKLPIFCGILFCLESMVKEKYLLRLLSEIFTPSPSPQPQLGQKRTLMKWHFRGCMTPNHVFNNPRQEKANKLKILLYFHLF